MIYTVGYWDSHMRGFENATKPMKIGKCCDMDGKVYPGGFVWRTRDGAQTYANAHPTSTVFGVLADWEHDTESSGGNKAYRYLLVDSELVLLEE